MQTGASRPIHERRCDDPGNAEIIRLTQFSRS